MSKDKKTPEEKEVKEEVISEPETDPKACICGLSNCNCQVPDIGNIVQSIKSLLPKVNLCSSPKKENTEMCEIHIVGTPDMILKILKIQ